MQDMKIGIQLYNFRDALKADFEGTLRRISTLGIDGVEFAAYYGNIHPEELAALLKELGLACCGTMFSADNLLAAETMAYKYAAALNSPAVTISAFIDFAKDYQMLAGRCNIIGARAYEVGAVLSYHNHWAEFTPVNGVPAMDLILQETDEETVFLEPDICWLTRAGQNPAEYIRRYGNRIYQVHVKDSKKLDDPAATTELGNGVVNIVEAVKAASETKCEWLIYEQDFSEDPFKSAEVSIKYLKRLL